MQTNLLEYLDEIVKLKPDKIAFSDGIDNLTFRELQNDSKAIGSWLDEGGFYKEPVIVFMGRHPRTIATFFGVLTAGCFYVPVDMEMSVVRIQKIVEITDAKIIICDHETYEEARNISTGRKVVLFEDICNTPVNEDNLLKIRQLCLDTDPVYVVFTSGSTGTPKGVVSSHRAVIDYIEHLSEALGFDETTVFGNQTPLYFDASMKEIYPSIKFGVPTYIIPKELFLLPVKLVSYLNDYKINTICWVVSALTIVSAVDTFKTIKPQYLKKIAFVGEVFPIKQFNKWKETLPHVEFFNLYGPTEGTGVCCYYKVDREFALDENMPVGRPFRNTEILLLKENAMSAGSGEEGEICIRGSSLALGYYKDIEKTKEVFVQNPLNSSYPEIIYKTGDIGKYGTDGNLYFVSRKDYQIKHMGHRIELGEIEVNANMLDGVERACCLYDKKKGKIILYYNGVMAEKDVVENIKRQLPRYMVPNRIVKIDKMPLTVNGKIDRKRLENNEYGKITENFGRITS